MSFVPLHVASRSVERRRHVRQKTFSAIIFVKLDNDNGGILLDLGTGGISLQAVAPINRDQNPILHLKFPDYREAIQLHGTVAWVGPTRKMAGICFRDVSDSAQQRISEWIEKQGLLSDAKELKAASPARGPHVAGETPFPPPRIHSQRINSQETIAEPEPNLASLFSSASTMGDAPSNSDAGMPRVPFVFAATFPVPTPTPPDYPEDHSVKSIADPTKLPSEPIQTNSPSKPLAPCGQTRGIPNKERASPDLLKLFFATVASYRNELVRLASILSLLTEKRHRRKLVFACAALCCLVLGLTVMLASHSDPAARATPNSQQQTPAWPSARSDSGMTNGPVPAPPAIVRQQAEAPWVAALKKLFLGIDDSAATNQIFGGAPVWSDRRSGYYYCADSPYFEKLKSGSIMTQSSALQSGYQPKLGAYCH